LLKRISVFFGEMFLSRRLVLGNRRFSRHPTYPLEKNLSSSLLQSHKWSLNTPFKEPRTYSTHLTILSPFCQPKSSLHKSCHSILFFLNKTYFSKRYFAEGVKSIEELEKEQATKKPHPKKGRKRIRKPNEAWAINKKIRISQKKLNYVCKVIRRLSFHEAVRQLKFSPKKVGRTAVLQTVMSARYNAENTLGLNIDRCIIDEAVVGRGEILKRIRYRGKGGMGIMQRRYSRLLIILKEVPYVPGERRLGKYGRLHPPGYEEQLKKSLVPPAQATETK
jgi:ribosomal protein L22